jgi:hypothetical protein
MNRLLWLMLLATATGGCTPSNTVPTSPDAVEALTYLKDRGGVVEHAVEGNSVFVIFGTPPPKDWKTILDAAALTGNEATGEEFMAAGIRGDSKNWRAYADSNTIGVATARDGQLIQQ